MAESNKTVDTKTQIWFRSRRVYAILTGFSLLMLSLILWKQYGPESYELRKTSSGIKNFRTTIEPAKRGNVLSHDGKIIATSISKYNIYMDFNAGGMKDSTFNKNVSGLASGLSKFFRDKSAGEYERMLRQNRTKRNQYKLIIPRTVNYVELQELKKLPLLNMRSNIGGSIIKHIYERKNPYGSLAQRTLGRANKNSGNAAGSLLGIEGAFDSDLSGVDGIRYERKISGSFWAPVNNSELITPQSGKDVVTTIDIEIQDVAEDALKTALEKHQADWGTAILMEVATGEIRAIANISRTNSGRFVEDYNYAIASNMEPGSTFKLVSLISLLDDASADIDEIIDCTTTGVAKVGPRNYYDSEGKGYGEISLQRVFELSSNIGFAKAVTKYYGKNPQAFVDDIKSMGITDDINFQIEGERKPMLRNANEKYWDGTTLGMLSTGYSGIMITPIRTLMLYNAVANDGKLITPLLVKRIEKDGKVEKEFHAKTINSSIAKTSTLRNIRNSLEGVVYDGTGALFLLNKNYKIAGKTGTAQVLVDGKYEGPSGVHYFGSFAGYFPADNPKYSCIVAIKTFRPYGSGKKYYGGTISGPVFKAIADRVYSHATDWGYEIEKPILDKKERERIKEAEMQKEAASILSTKKEQEIDKTAQSKKGDLTKIKKIADYLNIRKENVTFAGDNTLKSLLDNDVEDNKELMPNVVGMGLRDAVEILENRGLRVISSGKGVVRSQSISSSSKIKKGSTVYLTLSL